MMKKKVREQGIGTRILKVIGVITAVISLFLGIRQVVSIVQENAEKRKESSRLIAEARGQASSGDYSQAWKSVVRAVDLEPDQSEVQVNLAMEWLRNIHVTSARGEKSFTEVVEKVLPTLYRAVDTTKKAYSATILAHIGWANYLLFRDGDWRVKVEEQFRNALLLDSTNVYARAMLGFWMLFPGHENGTVEEANAQFEAAIRTGKEIAYTRSLMISAFDNTHRPESQAQIIRVANEMRKNHEPLDLSTRDRIVSGAYYMYRSEIYDEVAKVLTPQEHLATFLFLMEGLNVKSKPYISQALARLQKNAGAGNDIEQGK